MKTLIITLLLPVLLFSCKTAEPFTGDGYEIVGQNRDSTTILWQLDGLRSTSTAADSIGKRLSLWATPANHTTAFTISRRDTVPCIQFCIDTTFIPNYKSQFEFSDSLSYVIENRLTLVWWQFGFVIREQHTIAFTYPEQEWYSTIKYLDKDKRPLPKSIIVWMVKEIN